MAALVAGKGLDATSTVFVLGALGGVRETVPFARTLMRAFGVVWGNVVLTLVAICVVALLAESGALVARLVPDATPSWYPSTVREVVYLGSAAWFTFVGLQNLWLLFHWPIS